LTRHIAVKTIDKSRNIPASAIYYHPEAYSLNPAGRIMGRQSAGEGFLRGLFSSPVISNYYCYSKTKKEFTHFQQQLTECAPDKTAVWVPYTQPERLKEAGSLFYSGPGIGEYAWMRSSQGPAAYSLTGLTHTICSDAAMKAIMNLVTAPVEPWDALICTSRAVKTSVENILSGWEKCLSKRLSIKPEYKRLQLPIIPLGVDCEQYADSEKRRISRQEFRQKYNIRDSDVAVLYFGRLSIHAKAHPLPMFVALEEAARQTGKPVVLILAGWTANDHILKGFMDGARLLCPSVRVLIIDARPPEIASVVWAAADIFCSLSDNIQESFGLTPVEAQAAGLPVVVSDWDGYRDTVIDGITGFRIPTTMPDEGLGEELAWRYLIGLDNYDQYVARVSQCVAVDIHAATDAFSRLISSADLRYAMGSAGRTRACEFYDWQVIIKHYTALWAELDAIRNADRNDQSSTMSRRFPAPGYADPFAIFSSYPTYILSDQTVLQPGTSQARQQLKMYMEMEMNRLASVILSSDDICISLLEQVITAGEVRMGNLLLNFPNNRAQIMRTVGWLLKMGVIRAKPQ